MQHLHILGHSLKKSSRLEIILRMGLIIKKYGKIKIEPFCNEKLDFMLLIDMPLHIICFVFYSTNVFLTSYFGILLLRFTLFALTKASDLSPLKGETLHNGIIQTVASN